MHALEKVCVVAVCGCGLCGVVVTGGKWAICPPILNKESPSSAAPPLLGATAVREGIRGDRRQKVRLEPHARLLIHKKRALIPASIRQLISSQAKCGKMWEKRIDGDCAKNTHDAQKNNGPPVHRSTDPRMTHTTYAI